MALIEPVQSAEEWSLLVTQPLRELLTVRADYRVDRDEPLALSQTFSPNEPVQVWLPGQTQTVVPQWVEGRWVLSVRRTESERARHRVRVVARQLRAVSQVKLFSLGWPQISSRSAADAPTRTLAMAPREWLRSATAGWSCVDDAVKEVACVSIDTRPQPMLFNVSAAPSSRGGWLVALLSMVLGASALLLHKEDRTYRVPALVGGWLMTAFVALVLVGARWASWALALTLCSLLLTSVLIYLKKSLQSLLVMALALLVIPLLAVLVGGVAITLAPLVLSLIPAFWLARAKPVAVVPTVG